MNENSKGSDNLVLHDVLEDISEVLLAQSFLFEFPVVVNCEFSHRRISLGIGGSLKSQREVLLNQTNLEATLICSAGRHIGEDTWSGVVSVDYPRSASAHSAYLRQNFWVHAEFFTNSKTL